MNKDKISSRKKLARHLKKQLRNEGYEIKKHEKIATFTKKMQVKNNLFFE